MFVNGFFYASFSLIYDRFNRCFGENTFNLPINDSFFRTFLHIFKLVNGFSDKTIQVRKWLFSPIFRHFLCVFLNMYLLDFAILRHSFTVFCKNQTFVNGFFSEKTPSFRAFIFVLIFMVFVNGLSVVRKWLVTFHLLLMYSLFIRADRGVFLMWHALNKPFLVHFSLEKRVRKWLVGCLSMAFFTP